MTNIYIDENFSHHLAEGLNVFQKHLNTNEKLQIQVLSIKEIFGKGVKDEVWIPLVGDEKGIVITQDLKIQTTRDTKMNYIKNTDLEYSFLNQLLVDLLFGKWLNR